jgi:hypothetical protein
LKDPVVRAKLVHGSDWPILPLPPAMEIGLFKSIQMLCDLNWLRRDVRIKEAIGFDEAYWHRAAKILRLPPARSSQS